MKKLFIINFLLFISILPAIHLNKYGRIPHTKKQYSYEESNGSIFIKMNTHKFKGNILIDEKKYIITIENYEDGMPFYLRFFSKSGNLIFEKSYKRIINPKVSENGSFIIFSTGNNVISININSLIEKKYPNSTIFNINDNGEAIISYNGKITNKNISGCMNILIHNNIIYYFTNNYLLIEENKITYKIPFKYKFFEAKTIDDIIYITLRKSFSNKFEFYLYKLQNANLIQIDSVIYDRNNYKSHSEIQTPIYSEGENFVPVGNSYGEIQDYGGNPYLHPGVDFLGYPDQAVYAVNDGFLKAFLTIGGDYHWRIAVADENTSENCEGYLYAHLNEDSVPFTIGDSIYVGEQIGTLVDWPWYDFTHIHFARISCSGLVWSGNWWTTDDPLQDCNNFLDNSSPIFENTLNSDYFVFIDSLGEFENPANIIGKVKIISKCYDLINSEWKVDVKKMWFELYNENDSLVYSQNSHLFDMPLDTYFQGEFTDLVLNTIYMRSQPLYSIGNYEERDFYHIITNTDGDSIFTNQDSLQYFDSRNFINGYYNLFVYAEDFTNNISSVRMSIRINNPIVENSNPIMIDKTFININPNPCKEGINLIVFSPKNNANVSFELFNIKGQKVFQYTKKLQLKGTQAIPIKLNSDMNTGIYFSKVKIGEKKYYQKVLLLK